MQGDTPCRFRLRRQTEKKNEDADQDCWKFTHESMETPSVMVIIAMGVPCTGKARNDSGRTGRVLELPSVDANGALDPSEQFGD